MQKEAEDKDMSKIISTSVGTVTQVLNLQEKKKANKKMVMNLEQNTNHTYEYGDKCV